MLTASLPRSPKSGGPAKLNHRLPALAGWLADHQIVLVLIALTLWIEIGAALAGGDSNWDMRNYHLYNPFALFNGKFTVDVAPAGTQTYFAPTLDIPYYLLVRSIRNVSLINAILEIPHAIAIGLAYLLSVRLLRAGPGDVALRAMAAIATLIGATGAATTPVVATTMSDMIPVSLILGGLLLFIGAPDSRHGYIARIAGAAFLVGAAVGLKLVFVIAAVGLTAAILFLPPPAGSSFRARFVALAVGGLIGGVATAGWWWVFAWQHWGSPLFPLYNNIFHSPLVSAEPHTDTRFIPTSFVTMILYPFLWAVPSTWAATFHLTVSVGESYLRDPRIAIALVCDLILLVGIWRRRSWQADRNLAFIAIFFLVSLVAWELEFSILRYLSFIELISGTLMAATLIRLISTPLSTPSIRRLAPVMLSFLFLFLLVVTVSPHLARAKNSSAAIVSSIPTLPDDALVIMSDPSPLAYLAAFEPPNIPFIGANNLLVTPTGTAPLDHLASATIRNHKGPMWELATPADYPNLDDRALAAYGLTRIDCVWLTGNLADSGRVRFCRVVANRSPGVE